jgi:hypothetical protein
MPERSYRWEESYRALRGGHPAPVLAVTFSYARQTASYYGLVDSGAEWSACSIAIARAAGIDLDQFPARRIRGVGGITRARRCPMDLLILGRRIGPEILVVEANVVLLGRRDVFAAFSFGFDERAGTLLIEPYDER